MITTTTTSQFIYECCNDPYSVLLKVALNTINLYSIFSEIFNHAEMTTFSSSMKPHIKQKDIYMYLIYFWILTQI